MTSKRFQVVSWHGESGSIFNVVDTSKPEEDQPFVCRSFRDLDCARIYASEREELACEECSAGRREWLSAECVHDGSEECVHCGKILEAQA